MTSRAAYQDTKVSVSKSQEEMRALLIKFGAEQFTFGEGRDWAGIEFVHAGQLVRLRCPLRPVDPATVTSHLSTADKQAKAEESERQRVWRVLVWSTKARLVAVEEGLETFEQAFLSHLVDPGTDRTMWETVREPIESGVLRIGGPGLKALGSGR